MSAASSSTRDKRAKLALAILLPATLIAVAVQYWPESEPAVVAPIAKGAKGAAVGASAIPATVTGMTREAAEARLAQLRQAAAAVSAKQEIYKRVSGELAAREKGLIKADTAAQAQAQLMQIMKRIGSAESPPIEFRSTELTGVRPLGEDFGEVSVALQLDCRIDQLVNLLAALPSQPEIVTTSDLRVVSSNGKDKTVGVRLTVSGVVPKRLIPQKAKGAV